MAMPVGFDLLTLNVEHTVKTNVMALRQLLLWLNTEQWFFCRRQGYCPPVSCFTVCTSGILSPWSLLLPLVLPS